MKTFRIREHERFQFGGESELMVFDDARFILPSRLASLLAHCRRFKPLSEHARGIAGKLDSSSRLRLAEFCQAQGVAVDPGDDTETRVRLLLDRMAGDGLFESLDFITSSDNKGTSARPVEAVGILTSGSMDEFLSGVASFFSWARLHSRRCAITILDEPGTDENSRKDALDRLRRDFGVDARYEGPAQRAALSATLIDRGAAPELARLAAEDPRNAFLLSTAGRVAALSLCGGFRGFVEAPAGGRNLLLQSDVPLHRFWFLLDEPTAQSPTETSDDWLTRHERFLSKTASLCAREHALNGPLALQGLGGAVYRSLKDRTGRVGVTGMGALSSDPIDPLTLLRLAGGSRRRLLESEATFVRACSNAAVLRVAAGPTIAPRLSGISPALGLDNRFPLPPFPPGEGGSRVFFDALPLTTPDCLAAELPLAMNVDSSRSPAPPRAQSELLSSVVRSCAAAPGRTPAHGGARRLGEHLRDAAELDQKSFDRFLRNLEWARRRDDLLGLERALALYGRRPQFWHAAVEEQKARIRLGMTRSDPFFHSEFERGRIERYGRLLRNWHELRSAASEIEKRPFA